MSAASTFDDLAGPAVDLAELNPAGEWCQRWAARAHTWRHRRHGGFDSSRYRVEPLAETAAKSYVVNHHYSGSYPSAVHRFGLFLDGEADGGLVGVAVFGIPMQASVLSLAFPTLEPMVESYELSRFVLEGARTAAAGAGRDRAPANSESWFLARCFEELTARGVRGVVSFADPVPRQVGDRIVFAGHAGIIYQASNAVWAGRSTPRTLALLPDGTALNDRARQKVRSGERGHEHVERRLVVFGARPRRAGEDGRLWLADALDDVGATRLRHRGCYRYLFPLGTRSERAHLPLGFAPQSPYPKLPGPLAV